MAVYDILNTHQLIEQAPSFPEGEEMDKDAQDSVEIERSYRSSQDVWMEQAIEDDMFVHNVQHTKAQEEALKKRGQGATPVNMIYPAVEQAVAMLTTNRPRFQATAREDSDVKTGRALSELLTWIWEQSHGSMHLKTAIWDYYVKGRGVLHFYIDPEKNFGNGEICLQSLDPLEVYPDPNSEDRLCRDAAHICVSRVMTHEQIASLYPDAVSLLAGAPTETGHYGNTTSRLVAYQGQQFKGDIEDSQHEKYRVIMRYSKVKVPYYNIKEHFRGEERVLLENELEAYYQQPMMMMASAEQQQILTDGDLQQAMQLWEEAEDLGDGTRLFETAPQVDPASGQEIPGEQIVMQLGTFADLKAMGQVAEKAIQQTRIKLVVTLGGKLYRKAYLPIEEYPIIFLNNRHNRNPYPMSDVRFVRPIQQEVNKLSALVIANLASSTNVKAFIPRGSMDVQVIEQEWAKPGAAIIEFDAEYGAPVIAQPVPIPSATFAYIAEKKREIEQILGIYALMQGDASQAPSTHKGTIAIEQFGQRRIRAKLDDIELALNHMARTMIPLMQRLYTAEKVIRIIQPNHTVSETVVNQLKYDEYGKVIERVLDLTTGTYDAVVVSGSTLPANRFAMLDYYVDLYKNGIIDQTEVLKKTDVADMEGVLERSSMISQMQQQLQGMEGEIKKLQGDMQTRERELFHTKLDLEVSKSTRKVDAETNRMQKTTALYEARAADELDMVRREEKMAFQRNGSSSK